MRIERTHSKRFEEFLEQYWYSFNDVPIEFYTFDEYPEPLPDGIPLGTWRGANNGKEIHVFVNVQFLENNGLPAESWETVAAHEILHIYLQQQGFPATRPALDIPPDSVEAGAGAALQNIFHHLIILGVLREAGFNVDDIIATDAEITLERMKCDGEKIKSLTPLSSSFAYEVLIYVESNFLFAPQYRDNYRQCLESTNSRMVKTGGRCINLIEQARCNNPDNTIFAMTRIRDMLGMNLFVRVEDVRTGQTF